MSPNRIVALLTPVFALAAGWSATWLADNVPGMTVSADQLQAVFIAGALAVLAPAAQWLHGWQKYEERLVVADQTASGRRGDAAVAEGGRSPTSTTSSCPRMDDELGDLEDEFAEFDDVAVWRTSSRFPPGAENAKGRAILRPSLPPGHGSPPYYYVPGLVCLPGRHDTVDHRDRPPARGRRVATAGGSKAPAADLAIRRTIKASTSRFDHDTGGRHGCLDGVTDRLRASGIVDPATGAVAEAEARRPGR